jgi:decaprenylphospho-beta-D-erythro-pentofuranosid-2-ulose 2-reductase
MSKSLPSRILILGATSAIAMAVARRLLAPSAHFFLVARNPAKLEAVRRDLLTRGAAAVTVCAADLDDTAVHPRILSDAVQALGAIDLALIAHGILGDQERAQSDYAHAEAILQTNLLSAVSLITWLANYFETARHGTLAAISSVAGDRGRKSNYVYGASKGAMSIFLDGVRNRIDRAGVHVLTVRPGFVATPMTAHLPKGPLFASPDKVAQGIVKAITQRKDVAYVPGFWAPIMFIIRSIPEFAFKRLNL